ncbi:polymorphic toxin type 30 domain-containing protein [Brevibacillus brevis]|uniref:polymorphic toxin type 30 domain-containing protein n=1 Tax=Brevibacillus brevis TaxID=1393 RepID=UPI0007D8B144|nr:polymorphic toxin type 30 domain-containing protein [Brevibacillus brevis]
MSVVSYQVILNKWSTHVAKDVYERNMGYLQEDGIITDRLLGYAYADSSLGHDRYGETVEIFLIGDAVIVAEAAGWVVGPIVTGTIVYLRGGEFVKRAFTYLKSERGSIIFGNVAKLGTGRVGDFIGIRGSTVDDIISRIPTYAKRRELTPVKGKVEKGFEYHWEENGDGVSWRVRVHGPDASAPEGSNARNNWIVRVVRGNKYLDSKGNWHTRGIYNKNSPNYSEEFGNDTHIPIQTPIGG